MHTVSQSLKTKATGLLRYQRVSWTLLDQAVISGVNFTTTILLARTMPATEFGLYMLIYPSLLLLTSMQNSLITEPHNVLAAQIEDEKYTRFTGNLALAQLAFSVSLGVLVFTAGLVVQALFLETVGALLMVLGIVLAPWMAQEFVRRVLYTRSDSKGAFINDAISYSLQLIGVLIITHPQVLKASPAWALLVLGSSSLVAVAFGFFQLGSHISTNRLDYSLASISEVWADAWSFGKWRTAQNTYQWFRSSGKGWLIAGFLGLELYGAFRAAYHLVHALNPLRQAASAYLPSRASRTYANSGIQELHSWVKRTLLSILVPLLSALAILSFASPLLLEVAYENRYSNMGLEWVVILGAFTYGINFVRFPLETAILAMKQSKLLFVNNIIAFTVFLGLSIPFLYFYGIIGYLLASITAALLQTFYIYYLYAKLATRHE